jgi:L-aspartate oxidase
VQVLTLTNPTADEPNEPLNLADIRNSLKSLMWRSVGVRRDGAELAEAAENIEQWSSYVLSRQFRHPEGWELQNMLVIARIMIAAATARQETRGVHLRLDYPESRDDQGRRRITFLQAE